MKAPLSPGKLFPLKLFLSLLLLLACAVPATVRAQAFGPPFAHTDGTMWPGDGPFSVDLEGDVDSNGNFIPLAGWFQYGTDTSYGNETPHVSLNESGNTSLLATTGQLTATTTYHYRAAASNYLGTSYGSDATFLSPGGPSITSQPQNWIIPVGSSVTFSVSAINFLSLSYQWQKNGTNINNATATSLNLGNVQPSDAANYSALVTSPFEGGYQISSQPGYLRVGGYPLPTLQSTVSNGNFVFTWPLYSPPYNLQTATSLAPGNWNNSSATTTTANNTVTAIVPFPAVPTFYRLQHP